MAITEEQQFSNQTAGQADWDSGLNSNFTTAERGYHSAGRAASALNTLDVVALSSGGFFQRFDPNSSTIVPHGMTYTAAASGDSIQAVRFGSVRTVTIVNSTSQFFVPGRQYFVSAQSPGWIVDSYAGAQWSAGWGLPNGGFHFVAEKMSNALTTDDILLTAGNTVSLGYSVWINSGAFAFHFNPNSADARPHALAMSAAASGSVFKAILIGAVNSVVFNAALTPGRDYFTSALTPGFIVASYSAAYPRVGYAVTAGIFKFCIDDRIPAEQLTKVATITINPTSTHLFSVDVGKTGWIRDLLMKSNSADKVGLAFYSNSARTDLMYQTISGGVTTVASFIDRAGWPFDNTDASTLSGILYGKIWPDSTAVIASQDVQVRLVADRWR